MQYDLLKFSREYPAKFYRPGHNLPMMIFLDTIEHGVVKISDRGSRPGRFVYTRHDGYDREYIVTVSAGYTEEGQRYGCIVSGYWQN
jgi:hypothetical protein